MAKRPHPSGQKIKIPAVVGAVINLGHCLNLLDSQYLNLVKKTHANFVSIFNETNIPMPQNTGGDDLVDRKLDCAVLRLLHKTRDINQQPAFDTVRAAFFEGEELYANAGFAAKNHIQICVRNHHCIQGYFRPLDEEGDPIPYD